MMSNTAAQAGIGDHPIVNVTRSSVASFLFKQRLGKLALRATTSRFRSFHSPLRDDVIPKGDENPGFFESSSFFSGGFFPSTKSHSLWDNSSQIVDRCGVSWTACGVGTRIRALHDEH